MSIDLSQFWEQEFLPRTGSTIRIFTTRLLYRLFGENCSFFEKFKEDFEDFLSNLEEQPSIQISSYQLRSEVIYDMIDHYSLQRESQSDSSLSNVVKESIYSVSRIPINSILEFVEIMTQISSNLISDSHRITTLHLKYRISNFDEIKSTKIYFIEVNNPIQEGTSLDNVGLTEFSLNIQKIADAEFQDLKFDYNLSKGTKRAIGGIKNTLISFIDINSPLENGYNKEKFDELVGFLEFSQDLKKVGNFVNETNLEGPRMFRVSSAARIPKSKIRKNNFENSHLARSLKFQELKNLDFMSRKNTSISGNSKYLLNKLRKKNRPLKNNLIQKTIESFDNRSQLILNHITLVGNDFIRSKVSSQTKKYIEIQKSIKSHFKLEKSLLGGGRSSLALFKKLKSYRNKILKDIEGGRLMGNDLFNLKYTFEEKSILHDKIFEREVDLLKKRVKVDSSKQRNKKEDRQGQAKEIKDVKDFKHFTDKKPKKVQSSNDLRYSSNFIARSLSKNSVENTRVSRIKENLLKLSDKKTNLSKKLKFNPIYSLKTEPNHSIRPKISSKQKALIDFKPTIFQRSQFKGSKSSDRTMRVESSLPALSKNRSLFRSNSPLKKVRHMLRRGTIEPVKVQNKQIEKLISIRSQQTDMKINLAQKKKLLSSKNTIRLIDRVRRVQEEA